MIDISIPVHIHAANDDDDDDDDWNRDSILSAENGDNWFYFEDETDGQGLSQCARSNAHLQADEPPLTMAARSADGTTLIQFKYDSTPDHEVLHPGRCRFTGLVNVGDNNRHGNMEF